MNDLGSVTISYLTGIYDNAIYVSNAKSNGLYKIENDKIVYLANFPKEKKDAVGLHGVSAVWNSEKWFFPNLGKHLHIYDEAQNTIVAYELWPWSMTNRSTTCKGVIESDEDFILIPEDLHQDSLKIDKRTKELRIDDTIKRLRAELSNDDIGFASVCDCVDSTLLYFRNSRIFFEIFKDGQIRRCDIGECGSIKSVCSYERHKYFITSRGVYEKEKGIFTELVPFEKEYESSELINSICASGKIFALTSLKDEIAIIDLATKSIHNKHISIDDCGISDNVKISGWFHFWNMYLHKCDVVIAPVSSNKEVCINTDTLELKYKNMICTEDISEKCSVVKSEQNILKEYIDMVKEM